MCPGWAGSTDVCTRATAHGRRMRACVHIGKHGSHMHMHAVAHGVQLDFPACTTATTFCFTYVADSYDVYEHMHARTLLWLQHDCLNKENQLHHVDVRKR